MKHKRVKIMVLHPKYWGVNINVNNIAIIRFTLKIQWPLFYAFLSKTYLPLIRTISFFRNFPFEVNVNDTSIMSLFMIIIFFFTFK